jgi:uncharacterized membrane protein YccC
VSDKDIEMLRENLRAQRKQLTAQNMTLTTDEATKFWPIFDQYRREAINVRRLGGVTMIATLIALAVEIAHSFAGGVQGSAR